MIWLLLYVLSSSLEPQLLANSRASCFRCCLWVVHTYLVLALLPIIIRSITVKWRNRSRYGCYYCTRMKWLRPRSIKFTCESCIQLLHKPKLNQTSDTGMISFFCSLMYTGTKSSHCSVVNSRHFRMHCGTSGV